MKKGIHILPATFQYPETIIDVLEPCVASGSFSKIDKAILLPDGPYVAVKQTMIQLPEMPDFVFSHDPYVPRTYYRDCDSKSTLVVEEWIPGNTIYKLTECDSLNVDWVGALGKGSLIIIRDLLHNQRIYHGDLTPCNILFDYEKNNSIWIIDFDPWYEINEEGIVEVKNISGSMPFMPPEYLNGELSFYAEQAYVYCIGAILYYSLYKTPPYCVKLKKDIVERLMFGPQGLSTSATTKIQYQDFCAFREMLNQNAGRISFRYDDPYKHILRKMLEYRPESRIGIDQSLDFFNRLQYE